MSLSDITYDSVLVAVREYDDLGRKAFLSRYGFRRARDYFLSLNGRRHDSKAIAGVRTSLLYLAKDH
jgi:hypothetical protein